MKLAIPKRNRLVPRPRRKRDIRLGQTGTPKLTKFPCYTLGKKKKPYYTAILEAMNNFFRDVKKGSDVEETKKRGRYDE